MKILRYDDEIKINIICIADGMQYKIDGTIGVQQTQY